jgi:hypothetical protein
VPEEPIRTEDVVRVSAFADLHTTIVATVLKARQYGLTDQEIRAVALSVVGSESEPESGPLPAERNGTP